MYQINLTKEKQLLGEDFNTIKNELKQFAKTYFVELFRDEQQLKTSYYRSIPTLLTFTDLFFYFKEFDKPVVILKEAFHLYWDALQLDLENTTILLYKAAVDRDEALNEYWYFYREMHNWISMLDEEKIPIRDKVYVYFDLFTAFIEGVFKKEFWFLLSCFDIAHNASEKAKRRKDSSLGNMIDESKNLPINLASFYSEEPIKNISINQLRNIGAHRDFLVQRSKITLRFGKKDKVLVEVDLEDLKKSIKIINKLRLVTKVFINLAIDQSFKEIENLGYKPLIIPETQSVSLKEYLAIEGMFLEDIKKDDMIIKVTCETKRRENKLDFFNVLKYLPAILTMFQEIFSEDYKYDLHIIICFKYKKYGKMILSNNQIIDLLVGKDFDQNIIWY